MRRIVALLASPLAVPGLAVPSPGTAGAAPTGACTSTTTIEQLGWAPNDNGYLEPVGTYHHGYVGAEVDLTRTPEQALTSSDLRCGTAAFTAGATSYAHVGSRTSFGTT